MSQTFMWTHLVHLGSNMWNEEGNTRGREHRSTPCASSKLRFYRDLWDEHILKLKQSGVNALIIDIGEAMRYESHPELAVEGSWSHEEMRAEVARLKAMGFEVIPKLNFSACHDIWLKDYSRMLSTPIYYQVCRDVIEEVCEVFRPKYFHIGMDEENIQNQRNFDLAVVRQFDLWWKDFYYLVNCVEREGARAWIWSDYIWNHTDEFLRKMPKSVVQSNWYYSDLFTRDVCDDKRWHRLECFEILGENGYDQVPAGSVFQKYENFDLLTNFCLDHISPDSLMGFMQTSWERVEGPWMHLQKDVVDTVAAAKQRFDAE